MEAPNNDGSIINRKKGPIHWLDHSFPKDNSINKSQKILIIVLQNLLITFYIYIDQYI